MHAQVLTAVCVLLATATVVQSRRWFAPELSCWITQEKVPASWEDAQRRCERHGAVLASPLNTQLHNYLQSRITIHNDTVAYFLGTRAKRSDDGQVVNFVSLEGRQLDDMPMAVFDAITQLDLEQGDCLCMDRRGIRAVSCWDHLPYICYSNETAECGLGRQLDDMPMAVFDAITQLDLEQGDCLCMDRRGIRAVSCWDHLPYICYSNETAECGLALETTTSTTSTASPTTTIPPGYTYYAATGSYYKFHHDSLVSWHVANSTCASEGARLLVVNDAGEADIVRRIVKDATGDGYGTWTGLRDTRPGGVMEWSTVDGRRLDDMPRAVYDAIDELDLEQGDCLSMDRRGIRAVSCWDHLPYICYSNETAECGLALETTTSTTSTASPTTTIPRGYTFYPATGSYYKYHHDSEVSWHVASSTCASEGARLVVLNDAGEADIVYRIMKDATGDGYGTWTGLRDTRPGGVMEWSTVDGTPLSAVFHDWCYGRPYNDAQYTCAISYTRYKGLFDQPCDLPYYYLCEISQ